MNSRRKRPFSPDDYTDPRSGSTDSLCRAVKRLHTHSPLTSSCTTASKDTEAGHGTAQEEEACSPLQRAAGEPSSSSKVPTAKQQPLPAQPGDSTSRLLTPSGQGGGAVAGPSEGVCPRQPAVQKPVPAAYRPALGEQDQGRSGAGKEQGLSSLQRRLADVVVTNDEDADEVVAQPSTPVREECSSPVSGKGHKLGMSRELSPTKSDAYALLYEEANMLLKNLHFERLQRKAQH